MVFEGMDAVEHEVVNMLFSSFVPEMFLRVQLGRIRWKEQQTQIVGQAEVFTFVPPGAIEH
jgi:hypothetical protein